MSALSKFLTSFCLALCLIVIGAIAPSVGDDDPAWIVEISREGKCTGSGDGIKELCNCIPYDYGENTLESVVERASKLFPNPYSLVMAEWKVGLETEEPQLESKQIDIWTQYLTKTAQSELLYKQSQSMIKNSSVSRSDAFTKTFDEMKNINTQYDSNFPDYSGFTSMTEEEARLNEKWRIFARVHILAMKNAAGRYDTETSARNDLYNELMKSSRVFNIDFMAEANKQINAGLSAANIEGDPNYPQNTLYNRAVNANNDFSGSNEINESGQERLLEIITGINDQRSALIQRNQKAAENLQEAQNYTSQTKRAKDKAVKTNVITMSEQAANTQKNGKSHKIGF